MKILRAIDQGGILTPTGEIPSRAVWKALTLDEKIANEIWHRHDEAFFSGNMGEDEWWGYFIAEAPNKLSTEEIKGIFRREYAPQFTEIYRRNLSLVGRLTVYGSIGAGIFLDVPDYVPVIWTNNCDPWLDYQKKKFHVDNYVAAIISSHELKTTKHGPEYFSRALEETNHRLGYNFEKGKIIFFDDDTRYCESCEDSGMTSVHVPRPELFPGLLQETVQIKL